MAPVEGLAELDRVAMLIDDQVWYIAHPLRSTEAEISFQENGDFVVGGMERADAVGQAARANCLRALRWLRWFQRTFPTVTFIAPWIAAVLAGADDADEAQREHGLRDDCRVVERCDGLVACGGRVSNGMERERLHARQFVDLTDLGPEPPRS